jgi:serine/threonine-protein kinase HipA
VALRAAGEPMGYPELAQLLRRRGVSAHRLHQTQMRELFRRMVFNILLDNTDDHEKQRAAAGRQRRYRLSPAFDVRPSGQALGYQQMRVGAQEADSTLDNALSGAGCSASRPSRAAPRSAACARWSTPGARSLPRWA